MDKNAEDLLSRAVALSPQLTSELLGSGAIDSDDPRGSAGGVFVRTVHFGSGESEPYALKMHEGTYNLGPVSRSKPPTGDGPIGRKFLQRPYDRHKQRYIKEIARITELSIQRSIR